MPPFWGASCISLYSIEIFHQLLIEYFRYEPTRYVIIASHHDSWHKGAARPGIGHAVLMELVRTLGFEAMHNWKPGKGVSDLKKACLDYCEGSARSCEKLDFYFPTQTE